MKGLFSFIALMLCGCGKTQYKSVQDTLAELKNYSANADVTYFQTREKQPTIWI